MIIRKYKATDAIEILSERAKQPSLELNKLTEEWAKTKETKGPAVTAVQGDRIIGCGGLEIMWPGFAEGWCLFVEDVDRYTVGIARRAKRILKRWVKEYELVRIQAPLRADFPDGKKFAIFMGFKYEGILRKYFPDRCDALMFSWIGD